MAEAGTLRRETIIVSNYGRQYEPSITKLEYENEQSLNKTEYEVSLKFMY